jgi:hypothetical protein
MIDSFVVSRLVMISVLSGRRVFALEHRHRLARHDGRDRVLVNELRVAVATQENAEIVEGCHNTGELDAIDQKDRQRNLLLANGIEKKILEILRTFRHGAASFFFAGLLSTGVIIV